MAPIPWPSSGSFTAYEPNWTSWWKSPTSTTASPRPFPTRPRRWWATSPFAWACDTTRSAWTSPALARSTGSGLEAAGREVRLQWFRHLATSCPTTRVATAHTAEDQAETVLLRLLRGTGLAGTAAIRACLPLGPAPGGPTLIRPLLAVTRAHARAYALTDAWSLCEDPTNQDVRVPRNRVRHCLLPLLARDFNPSVVDALCRLAASASDDQAVLAPLADEAWSRLVSHEHDTLCVSTDLRLLPAAVRARVWTRALREAGAPVEAATLRRLDDLLHGPRRRRLVAAGLQAERVRDVVAIQVASPSASSLPATAAAMLAASLAAPRIPDPGQEEPAAPGGKAP